MGHNPPIFLIEIASSKGWRQFLYNFLSISPYFSSSNFQSNIFSISIFLHSFLSKRSFITKDEVHLLQIYSNSSSVSHLFFIKLLASSNKTSRFIFFLILPPRHQLWIIRLLLFQTKSGEVSP